MSYRVLLRPFRGVYQCDGLSSGLEMYPEPSPAPDKPRKHIPLGLCLATGGQTKPDQVGSAISRSPLAGRFCGCLAITQDVWYHSLMPAIILPASAPHPLAVHHSAHNPALHFLIRKCPTLQLCARSRGPLRPRINTE